jgi:hypothetical protein
MLVTLPRAERLLRFPFKHFEQLVPRIHLTIVGADPLSRDIDRSVRSVRR